MERENGIPRNPFINAGAIVICDILLAGHEPKEAIGETFRFLRFLANDDGIIIDSDVAVAEKAGGFRNVALANFMMACGNLNHPSASRRPCPCYPGLADGQGCSAAL